MGRTSGTSRKSTRRSTPVHGAEQVTDVGKLVVRMGALLRDADARAALVAAGRETVNQLGGGLDRTVAALEPYLMQIRLERRESDA